MSILPSFLPVPAYVLELVCNSMSILPERGNLNTYTGINSNSMRSVVCAALRRGGSRLGSAGDQPAADDASKAKEERRIQARSASNKQYSLVCLDRLREPWQQRKVQHCVRKEKGERERERERENDLHSKISNGGSLKTGVLSIGMLQLKVLRSPKAYINQEEEEENREH